VGIENGEIRPVISALYQLEEIGRAHADFLTKQHIDRLVLIPPAVTAI
jgi:NADPH:quinone reductase-like Zn-dependent oxidoreductase